MVGEQISSTRQMKNYETCGSKSRHTCDQLYKSWLNFSIRFFVGVEHNLIMETVPSFTLENNPRSRWLTTEFGPTPTAFQRNYKLPFPLIVWHLKFDFHSSLKEERSVKVLNPSLQYQMYYDNFQVLCICIDLTRKHVIDD